MIERKLSLERTFMTARSPYNTLEVLAGPAFCLTTAFLSGLRNATRKSRDTKTRAPVAHDGRVPCFGPSYKPRSVCPRVSQQKGVRSISRAELKGFTQSLARGTASNRRFAGQQPPFTHTDAIWVIIQVIAGFIG